MFKKIHLLFLGLLPMFTACSQAGPKAAADHKSITIEYAHEGVKADDAAGQMMFAKTRYLVHGDADYFLVRKFADNPDPKSLDAVIVDLVWERKTGKAFSLVNINGQKLKTEDGEPDVQAMTSKFMLQLDAEPVKMEGSAAKVQGLDAQKWTTKAGEGMEAPVFYTAPSVEPGEALKGLPIFMEHNGQPLGLFVGKDTKMVETYALRAQKIEFDKPLDVKAMLTDHKTSSKDEINQAMKALLGF